MGEYGGSPGADVDTRDPNLMVRGRRLRRVTGQLSLEAYRCRS